MLNLVTHDDYLALSRHVADWLIARIKSVPDALLCLAAGTTPTLTYQLLAERFQVEPWLFDRVRILKLDEWGGLAVDDPATCEHFLQQLLIEPMQLGERYISFNSDASEPAAECQRITDWLAANAPIDTCVLGLGVNGHIGFNEPAPQLNMHAHVATLSEESLQHAMLSQARRRPTYGLTLGMADITHARHVLLLVSGAAKHVALQRLLAGPICCEFPASLLKLHPDLEIHCDQLAHRLISGR